MAGLSQVNLKRDYTLDNTKKLEKGKNMKKTTITTTILLSTLILNSVAYADELANNIPVITQPTTPAQPTDPVVPTQPTTPAQPTDPVAPTQPITPTQPTTPAQLTDPSTPLQLIRPAVPDTSLGEKEQVTSRRSDRISEKNNSSISSSKKAFEGTRESPSQSTTPDVRMTESVTTQTLNRLPETGTISNPLFAIWGLILGIFSVCLKNRKVSK